MGALSARVFLFGSSLSGRGCLNWGEDTIEFEKLDFTACKRSVGVVESLFARLPSVTR